MNPLNRLQLFVFVLLLSVAGTATAQTILPALGSSRSGTSGFQFLKIPVDPRAAGMGNSSIADALDGSSLYWNPALASQMRGSQVYMAHTAYFVDIPMLFTGYVHRFGSRAIGVSLQYLDSGDIMETTEFNPRGTGRTFRTLHMAVGLTYSQQLTSLFSYGVTAKYATERIENISFSAPMVDMGFFYKVGETGLRFAVGVNNFGFDASPSGETTRITLGGETKESEFERVSPPTTFTLGAAYDVIKGDMYNILLTGQLTNPSDNSERLSLGTEFRFMNQFFLRSGYEFGVDEAAFPAFGAGVRVPIVGRYLSINYGFTTRDRLGSLHRVSLLIGL